MHANLQAYKFASMQTWKHTNLQACKFASELPREQIGKLRKLACVFYTSTHSLSLFFVPYIELGAWLKVSLVREAATSQKRWLFSGWFLTAIVLGLPFVYCFSTFGAQLLALCYTVVVLLLVIFCKTYGVYCFLFLYFFLVLPLSTSFT